MVVVGGTVGSHEDEALVALVGHLVIMPDLVGIGTRLIGLVHDLVRGAVFEEYIAAVGAIARR